MGSGFRCQAARPKVSSMPRYRRVITWVRSWMRGLTLVPLIPVMGCCAVEGQAWDVASDTWAATDGLGRKVALFPEVSKPRADRTVGMF